MFFYHVTSKEGASQIVKTWELMGKEFYEVYAWTTQPTLQQAKDSGAWTIETVVRFKAHPNIFEVDLTVPDKLKQLHDWVQD